MVDSVEIVAVDADSLASRGFFCRKSKMKTTGNLRKLAWADAGFERGLGIEILYDEGRSVGFIEYVPGEQAWRAVNAAGFMMIHCIWVVGRAKEKGYGSALLERAETAARAVGSAGVAMVTTPGVWLADNQLLVRHGYSVVDEAPPSFHLMVKAFDDAAPLPSFPTDWEKRAAALGPGLTVVTTDQCPYLEDAEHLIIESAEQMGIAARLCKLETAAEVRKRSPSPFGIFGVVLDGELLAYHYLLEKDLTKLIGAHQ